MTRIALDVLPFVMASMETGEGLQLTHVPAIARRRGTRVSSGFRSKGTSTRLRLGRSRSSIAGRC